jgi:hypothetical protein
VFVFDKPFQLSLMIVDKSRTYLKVEILKYTSLGYAPGLSYKHGLGWKGLPVSDTLAHYEKL